MTFLSFPKTQICHVFATAFEKKKKLDPNGVQDQRKKSMPLKCESRLDE